MASAFATLAFGAVVAAAWAAAGNLDPSFSNDGLRTVAFGTGGDIPNAVAIRGDGRIVVAGESTPSAQAGTSDFAIASIKPNGTLDGSFSNDGRRTIGITPGSSESGFGVAIQRDGKVVVAGVTASGANQDFAVVRLKANGAPDPMFSGDGRKAFGFANGIDDDVASAVAIQPNGKIVIAGSSEQGAPPENDFAVARLNPGGSLDTTFSNDGRRTVRFTDGDDHGFAMKIQSDGKIVVAGQSESPTTGSDFAVARLNPGGGLDTTFSNDGRRTVAFGGDNRSDDARGLGIRSDGKIVLAGTSDSGAGSGANDFAVARLRPNGGLDGNFSGDGRTTTGLNNGDGIDRGFGMALQRDGKIVVVGRTVQASTSRAGVARFKANGALDNTFSGDGLRFIAFPGEESSEANAVAIHNGRIVVAAAADFGSARDYDFGVGVLRTG